MEENGDLVAERVSPAAAFELVAHETRIEALEALRAADGGPLSFGKIREAVSIDDPGQCHYHVDRLVGQFVERTDEGYRLSPAGWRLLGAVISGGLTASLSTETVPADGTCSNCGAGLEATVRAAGVTIECRECEFVESDPDIPPAALAERPLSAIPRAVGRYIRRMEIDAAHGFCPNCEGGVDRTVAIPDDDDAPDWFDGEELDAVVVTDCRRCGYWWHAAVPIAALVEPAVIAFHHRHGIDIREHPWWTLDHVEFGAASVTANPRRVSVPMELDGDARTFVFDGKFAFVREREA